MFSRILKRWQWMSLCIAIVVVSEITTLRGESNSAPFESSKIRLRHYIDSNTPIRVQIFPHLKDYPPHGRDIETSRVTLKSKTACKLFMGHTDRTGKIKAEPLSEFNELEINAEALAHPLWTECPSPIMLIRGESLPIYEYSGSLYIRRSMTDDKPFLQIINVISLKSYLKGVVPSEVFSNWPAETLKTQAVAARTYAVFHLSFAKRYRKSRFYDLDDTIQYQAYTGVTLSNKQTDEAVIATKNQILMFGDDVIQAYYHADSGGYTEDAHNVWGSAIAFVEAKHEEFYGVEPVYTWNKRIRLSQISQWLVERGITDANNPMVSVFVPGHGRTKSARVIQITATLKDGQQKIINIDQFRRLFGSLPSTRFRLEKEGKDLVVIGQGFGHGVGLNQRGAEVLAKSKGWSYRRILDYYYSNTVVCSLKNGKITPASVPNCLKVKPLGPELASNPPSS